MLSQDPAGTDSHKRARRGSLAGTEQIIQRAEGMQMELNRRENSKPAPPKAPPSQGRLGTTSQGQENMNYFNELSFHPFVARDKTKTCTSQGQAWNIFPKAGKHELF